MIHGNAVSEDAEGARSRRLTGLFGLGWFVLFVVGGLIVQGQPPTHEMSVGAVREYVENRGERYLVGDYLLQLAFPVFLLCFITGLRAHIGRYEDRAQLGSRILLSGGVLMVTMHSVATVFVDALAFMGEETDISDSVVRAMLHMNAVTLAELGVPMALVAFAASLAVWRTGALWRGQAAIGAVTSVLALLGAAFPLGGGSSALSGVLLVGHIAFAVLVVSVSVNLLFGKRFATGD